MIPPNGSLPSKNPWIFPALIKKIFLFDSLLLPQKFSVGALFFLDE
jgi:hypothetical protein